MFMLLLVLAGACKKDKTTSPGNNTGTNPTEEGQIKFSFSKVSTPAYGHTLPTKNVMGLWMEMLNGDIFIASPDNADVPQYFLRYNVHGNEFEELDTIANMCWCGHLSTLISDKDNALYYINSVGVKFNMYGKEWSNITVPNDFRNTIAENGTIYLNRKLYHIGGRGPSVAVKYYDINTSAWKYVADYPYPTNAGHGVGIANKLYVFGGVGTGNKMCIYDEATDSWASKPDMPFEMPEAYAKHRVARIDNEIYVLGKDAVYIYNVKEDKWLAQSVAIPAEMQGNIINVNMFSYKNKLYLTGTNNAFHLYEATIEK